MCDDGRGDACTSLGNVVRSSNYRRPEATQWYLRGCDLGDAAGCEEYASIQLIDNRNDALAAEGWAKGCKLGSRLSCHQVGLFLFREPATSAAAANMFEETCARDFPVSCTMAAIARAPLLGPLADCKRAVPFAEKTCPSRIADACAIIDACKLSVDAERAAALQRLRTGCDRKVQLACLYWADAQPPAVASSEQIHAAYEVACQRREAASRTACPRLAALDVATASSEAVAQRYIAVLNKACALSVGEACCVLADIHKTGKWLTSDPARVADLRSKACILGQSRCCAPADR